MMLLEPSFNNSRHMLIVSISGILVYRSVTSKEAINMLFELGILVTSCMKEAEFFKVYLFSDNGLKILTRYLESVLNISG